MNMFCAGCGNPLKEGTKFCTMCGRKVAAQSAGEILKPETVSSIAAQRAGKEERTQGVPASVEGGNNGYLAGVLSLGTAVGLQFLKKDKKEVPAR